MVKLCSWTRCTREANEGSNYCTRCNQKYIQQERQKQKYAVMRNIKEQEGVLVKTYKERDEILLEIGYKNYQEYLSSDLWKAIRRKVFYKCGNKCKLCQKEANVIHHKGYGKNILLGLMLDPLIPLCHSCHSKVEFHPDNTKRSLMEANGFLTKLLSTLNPVKKEKKVKEMCRLCGKKARKGKKYCRPCYKT